MIKNIKDSIEDNKQIEDKTNDDNNENKNKIDYEEKLKEVDELKNKVNELTNNFTSLQKTLEEFIKTNSQTKSNEKTHIIDEDGEKIRKYTKTRSKFDRRTGQMVVYAEELNDKDRDRIRENEVNQESEKRSNYSFNPRSTEEILQDIDEKYNELERQNKNIQSINGKLTVKQKELPFWDKTGSVLGGAIGGLIGGIPGAMIGGSIFNEKHKDIDEGINGVTRSYLVNNPVQTCEEFIERLKTLFPKITEEKLVKVLEVMSHSDDFRNYNNLLLQVYDKQKEKLLNDKIDLSKKYKIENNLKEIIKKSPYIQEEVARMIGISSKTLSNIISNKFSTSLDVALKISYLFNIPVNDIFKLVEINEEDK